MQTKEMDFWRSDFGKNYTDRNIQSVDNLNELYKKDFGLSRTDMNQTFLGNKSIQRVLEVGSNVGLQLQVLQQMGYTDLFGIELQWYAVEKSKELTRGINIIQGSAFDLPFKDNYFDLVFTSGLLIHISPEDIGIMIDEMYRVSRKYIWCFEFFSEQYVNGEYRGTTDKLWKANFAELFLQRHPDLKINKEIRYKYLYNDNVNQMFILEKADFAK